ncbi:hypothetical protein GWN42_10000 [candidate division KSB1 bacterium]|nr:hypothetical protein [candidate division KSB1 bacterium]
MMSQGVLPFKHQEEKKEGGMTGLAGSPTYLDLANVVGLRDSIARHVRVWEGEQATEGDSICPYQSAESDHGAFEAVDHAVGLWASSQ